MPKPICRYDRDLPRVGNLSPDRGGDGGATARANPVKDHSGRVGGHAVEGKGDSWKGIPSPPISDGKRAPTSTWIKDEISGLPTKGNLRSWARYATRNSPKNN